MKFYTFLICVFGEKLDLLFIRPFACNFIVDKKSKTYKVSFPDICHYSRVRQYTEVLSQKSTTHRRISGSCIHCEKFSRWNMQCAFWHNRLLQIILPVVISHPSPDGFAYSHVNISIPNAVINDVH